MKGKSLNHVQLFVTPWTAAYQAPSSMGFSRQEYWSGVPLPSPFTKYERSANQNFNKVSPHTRHNGHKQKLQTVNPGEGVEYREPSYSDAGNGNWEQPLWRTPGSFLSTKMRLKLDDSLTPYTKINCK